MLRILHKVNLIVLVLTTSLPVSYGQATDSIYIDAAPGSENTEINILFEANNIRYYKMDLGRNPSGKAIYCSP